MRDLSPLGTSRVSPRIVSSEHGFTLTELAIVGTLAVLVMLGLMGFYFNSQRMWLDGSTQAMTQRDATMLVDVLARDVHPAAQAIITPVDADHDRLELYDASSLIELAKFEINAEGKVCRWAQVNGDFAALGPVADSKAVRLKFATDGKFVDLTLLEMISANGD